MLYGEVRTSDGKAAIGIRDLSVFAGTRGGFAWGWYVEETGRYVIPLPFPGDWVLGIETRPTSGVVPAGRVAAAVAPGKAVRQDLLVERVEGIVSGEVMKTDGSRAVNVLVRIRDLLFHDGQGTPIDIVTKTNGNGEYLALLPQGQYAVQAFSAADARVINPEFRAVDLGAPGAAASVGLTFRTADQMIPVRVVFPDGRPAKGASVWGWSTKGGFTKGVSGSDGRVELLAFDHKDVWSVSATFREGEASYTTSETVVDFRERTTEQTLTLAMLADRLPKERTIVADARKPLAVTLGNMALFLPAGAAAENGLITVRVRPSWDIPLRVLGTRVLGPAYEIEVAGPEGPVKTFKKQIRVEVPFTARTDRSAERAYLSFWNEEAGHWVSVPSVSVRSEEGYSVVGSLDHLTTLVATEPEGSQTPSASPSPPQSSAPGGSAPAPFDFALSAEAPTLTITRGQSLTDVITITLLSGSSQNVNLSALDLPVGVTASFAPAGCILGCSSILTVSTSVTTPSETHTITVRGEKPPRDIGDSSVVRLIPIELTVNAPTVPSPSPTSSSPASSPSPTPSSPPQGGGSPLPPPRIPLSLAAIQVTGIVSPSPTTHEVGIVYAFNQLVSGTITFRCGLNTGETPLVVQTQAVQNKIIDTASLPIAGRGGAYACLADVTQAGTTERVQTSFSFVIPVSGTPTPPLAPGPAPVPAPVSAPRSPSPQPASVSPASRPVPAPVLETLGAFVPELNVTEGDTGVHVRNLQAIFRALGYAVEPTGVATKQLTEIVKDFQSRNRVPATGVFASQTRAALRRSLGLSPAAAPVAPSPTRAVPTSSPVSRRTPVPSSPPEREPLPTVSPSPAPEPEPVLLSSPPPAPLEAESSPSPIRRFFRAIGSGVRQAFQSLFGF